MFLWTWTWEWLRHSETQSRGDGWCNTWHKRSIRGMQPGWCANPSINTPWLLSKIWIQSGRCFLSYPGKRDGQYISEYAGLKHVYLADQCPVGLQNTYCSVSTANNFWLLGWHFFFRCLPFSSLIVLCCLCIEMNFMPTRYVSNVVCLLPTDHIYRRSLRSTYGVPLVVWHIK